MAESFLKTGFDAKNPDHVQEAAHSAAKFNALSTTDKRLAAEAHCAALNAQEGITYFWAVQDARGNVRIHGKPRSTA